MKKSNFDKICTQELNNESSYLKRSLDESLLQKHVRFHFYEINSTLGLKAIKQQEYTKAKIRFNWAAMICDYCHYTYKRNWWTYNIRPMTIALLSDNTKLIERFANLDVTDKQYYYHKDNKPAPWVYTIQGLLKNDTKWLGRGLGIFEKNIESRKSIRTSRAHLNCTNGILNNDTSLLLEGIDEFESASHKKNLINLNWKEEILSFYPLAYMKIACMKGLFIDPKSQFIPLGLLELETQKKYSIPYWFLRDFYRSQGIDWTYDPTFPELQNGT